MSLIDRKKVVAKLSNYLTSIKNYIQSSELLTDNINIVNSNTIFAIYSRRMQNLKQQHIECTGLQETLEILENYNGEVKLLAFGNKNYVTTVILDTKNELIIGSFFIPISEEKYKSFKK
jgi:glyceraldehyde-3-phosphate dehydrogenase/erythrose-4-phosphate dehydrogenase